MNSILKVIATMLLSASLIACDQMKKIDGATDDIKEVRGSVQTTNQQIADLNAVIYKQTLLVAMDELLKESNYEKLTPFPTGLIAPGKAFAEVASSEKVAELTKLWLAEINETYTPATLTPNPEKEFSFQKAKFSKIMALQVIAAYLPDATVEDLVQTQICEGGIYKHTAFEILAMRYAFLGAGLVPRYLDGTLPSLGVAKEAFSLIKKMQIISAYPFVKDISIKTTGIDESIVNSDFEPFFYNFEFHLADVENTKMISDSLTTLSKRLVDLQVEDQVYGEDPAQIAKFNQEKAELQTQIDQMLGSIVTP